MMKFLIPVFALCLLVVGVAVNKAQQTRESIQDLRHRCFDAMQRSPRSAPPVCREYLNRSSEDDARAVKVVRDWLAAYEKVQPYVKALFSLTRPETDRSWLVSEPDLSLEIPQVTEKEGAYKIELDRSFNGAAEEALLKKAEAVYQSPIKMIDTLLRDPRWLADNLPKDNEPLWWVGGNDNVRLTTVVTARAVLHYYDLSRELRRDPAAVPGFPMNQTSLKYHATIKHCEKYSRGENNFNDVYVADLNLEWSHSCVGLCGMAFERNKIVILSSNGRVLAMYLDAPVNSTFTVS
jgi:hypothetical protein